ncbi:hypothetical protein NQZ68_010683 [Dissostichus eleginoides]|nr:hypothetical protein NQZ68_010683 [Dissostichus eleginoides]
MFGVESEAVPLQGKQLIVRSQGQPPGPTAALQTKLSMHACVFMTPKSPGSPLSEQPPRVELHSMSELDQASDISELIKDMC